jgi:hypothetical protein
MALSYELSTRLADSSIEYLPSGQIRIPLADQTTIDNAAAAQVLDAWRVERFLLPGEVLSASTCNAALIAAEAAAYARAGDQGVAILVPAGTYTLSQTVRVRGRGGNKRAPYIIGAGVGATIFEVPALPTGGTYSGAGACFWLDGSYAANSAFYNGGLIGITIKMMSEHGAIGVYGEGLLHSKLCDLDVIGYGTVNYYSAVSGQTGAAASCSAADANGEQTWTGLTGVTLDCEGRAHVSTGATTGANNGTFTITRYVSATSYKVFNPSGTSDASNGSLGWTEKYTSTGYKFRGEYVNSRGVTIANNQDVRMDNVRSYGMGVGAWLEAVTQFSITHFKIENNGRNVCLGHRCDQLSITSALFQGIGTYVVWEIPGRTGNKMVTLRDCYQEGAATAWLKTYPPISGMNDYVLEDCGQGNAATYIDASGTRSIIVRMPGNQAVPSTAWAKLRNVGHASFTGGVFESPAIAPTKWDLDLASRVGFSVNGSSKRYHGSHGVEKGLNRFLIGRGDLMAEVWDGRAVRKRTVNAGNLEALVGIVNGITLGPVNAAIYPTWTASNAAFNGAPTWNVLPGAIAAAGALKATMTVGALPVGSQPGLLCVFRNPSAADASNHYQRFVWTDGTNSTLIGMSDSVAVGAPGTDDSFYFYNQIVGQVLGPLSSTDTQAIYGGVCPAAGGTISGECNTADFLTTPYANMAAYASVAAGTVTVFGPATQPIDNAIEVAWCGVTKRGMTRGELEQFLDLAAAEFGPIARY